MKIGIMSMQRIPNNGSFLQSYSLKRNLELLGNEVEFVDYLPGPVVMKNTQKKENRIKTLYQKCKKHFWYPRKDDDRWNRECNDFRKWEKEYREKMMPVLGVTQDSTNQTEDLDLLVIGSDEVFNCIQPNPAVGFSKQLFGADSHAQKVISYAASFGNTSLEGLRKYGMDEEVGNLLKKMDAISVRDKNSVQMVQSLTGIQPEYHVDPVFLYDYEKETEISVDKKGYIVVYAYAGRITQKEAKYILKFAKKYNKEIICLAGAQEYFGTFIKTNPFETLAYVKNADYVITDTFHGTVFSIKYNKKFATLVRGGEGITYGNSMKLVDLLERFGLKNHIVDCLQGMENILVAEQDYTAVNQEIQNQKEKSIKYLSSFME